MARNAVHTNAFADTCHSWQFWSLSRRINRWMLKVQLVRYRSRFDSEAGTYSFERLLRCDFRYALYRLSNMTLPT